MRQEPIPKFYTLLILKQFYLGKMQANDAVCYLSLNVLAGQVPTLDHFLTNPVRHDEATCGSQAKFDPGLTIDAASQ